MKAVCSNVS